MSPRSGLWLGVKSALAALWFALMFFAAIPAGILWLAGADLAPSSGPLARAGGLLMAAAAVALLPPTIRFVREGRGTQAPFDPPVVFVSEGLYRWTRNPMYALYVLILAGEAALFASFELFLYTVAFVALAHGYVTGVEEKALRRRFGRSYADYCERVPRWLPRWPARSK